jgi:hypothetical protein
MGATVFVLGAGASYGDPLEFMPGYTGDPSAAPPQPPLTNQFFLKGHLNGDPKEIEERFGHLFWHIRKHWRIVDVLGGDQWRSLSIEDVFSSLSLLNEFAPPGTDEKATSRLLLNELTRFIRRTISMSTLYRFGPYTETLARSLKAGDSVISFNYDLLMDQEFFGNESPLQYQNFCVKFLGTDLIDTGREYDPIRRSLTEPVAPGTNGGPSGPLDGLYLKLHGSLNWFTCPNPLCPKSRSFVVLNSVSQCLAVSAFSTDFQCGYCQGELTALLVPPLAQKPVMNNPHLRNIWGNAFGVLANASRVVIIGFSFQPSDFYAAWLFRYALRYRPDTRVVVVNPDNKKEEFQERMRGLFGDRYDGRWHHFDQVGEML